MSNRSSTEPHGVDPAVLDAGLARYELIKSLGQGHHGELLLARQRYNGAFSGYAVLKRLNPVTREQDYHRLVEEARLGGLLLHSNIVSVRYLDGPLEDPLLILEHVEGYRLDELLGLVARAGRSLTEAFACRMAAEVADALHYAHERLDENGRTLNVVHRDVTPFNILVSKQGEVKLRDFGTAWSRLAGRVPSEGDSYQGTLAYGSPERAGLEPLDERSDLFSLGVILLQLLTGRHLFNATARFEAEIRGRQLRTQADALIPSRVPGLEELGSRRTRQLMKRIRGLSVQEVGAATDTLPEGLRFILRKVLAPLRQERFQTGAELSLALREYLWSTERKYGRAELAAEVAALREAALKSLEEEAPAPLEGEVPGGGHGAAPSPKGRKGASRPGRSGKGP